MSQFKQARRAGPSFRRVLRSAAASVVEAFEPRRLLTGTLTPVTPVATPGTREEGYVFSGELAGFTDTQPDNRPYVTEIDWGDDFISNGTVTLRNGVYYVAGSHTYSQPGEFAINVFLFDGAPGAANVSDGEARSQTFTITPKDKTPVPADDTLRRTFEDIPAAEFLVSSLIANDFAGVGPAAGETKSPLTVTGVSDPVGGTVALDGDYVVFKPDADFNGAASFNYTVRNTALKSATATARFEVAAVNDAPVARDLIFDDPETFYVIEDGSPAFINRFYIQSVTPVGPENESGQDLTVTGVSDAHGCSVTLENGGLKVTFDPNYYGLASFMYTVTDNGQTDGKDDFKSDTAAVAFDVIPVNDAPIAKDDTLASAPEDTPYTINFRALTDDDSPGPLEGDRLTVTAVGNATGGTVAIVDGKVVFTPAPNYNGPAGFDYTVTDNGSTFNEADPKSDTGRATFTVTPVNDSPTALSLGNKTVAENKPAGTVVGTFSATDPDDSAFTYALVGTGNDNALFTISGNTLKTAKSFDFETKSSYAVRVAVSDGKGGKFEQAFTISVTDVNENRSPVAVADAATTTPGKAVTVNVIGNDTDADKDALTVSAILTAPANGAAAIVGNKIVYTPYANGAVGDTLVYQVSDGRGGLSTAKLSLGVVSGVGIAGDPLAPTQTDLDIVGTNNSDTIAVQYAGTQGKASVVVNGVNKGTFSFNGRIVVNGLRGNDKITIDPKITRAAIVYGGAGNDTVSGGGGNDVFIGGDNDDSLLGGGGRDILVGGNNADVLNGGDGDDVLIGGSTVHDARFAAFSALVNEWGRTDASYATRVNNLRNGTGRTGGFRLDSGTVTDGGNPADTLTGGGGTDLFYAAAKKGSVPADVLKDRGGSETVVNV